MTMRKDQLVALVKQKFPPPKGLSFTDDDLVEAMFENLVSGSGSGHIVRFLNTHNINAGWFATMRKVLVTEQQAKLLENALKIAQSFHEMDNIVAAQTAGVPRTVYDDVIGIKLQTDEDIRKYRETVGIDKSAGEWKERGEAGLNLGAAMRAEIDKIIDEIAELKAGEQTEAVKTKLKFRRRALKAKEKEYDERFGRA